jgi:hypothetical protein
MKEQIQVAENRIVFSEDAALEAIEQGEADPNYVQDYVRSMQRQAIVEGAQTVLSTITKPLGTLASHVALETRMALFDYRHGTNYRAIRHSLVEEQKRKNFEQRIGLVAISR